MLIYTMDFLIPLLCRATWNVGPADLSAASRCQSQRGHGLPQRCFQWEELGIPHEGEVITSSESDSMSNIIIYIQMWYTAVYHYIFYAVLEYINKKIAGMDLIVLKMYIIFSNKLACWSGYLKVTGQLRSFLICCHCLPKTLTFWLHLGNWNYLFIVHTIY